MPASGLRSPIFDQIFKTVFKQLFNGKTVLVNLSNQIQIVECQRKKHGTVWHNPRSLKFYAHETCITLLVIFFAVCQYYSARINQELYVFRSARIFYMLWMWSEGW